jgi:hypothetical protein
MPKYFCLRKLGSCVTSVCCQAMAPPPSHQRGRHARRRAQGFSGGDREGPRGRVHASDGAPRRPARGPSALPGLALALAAPIPLGIPGPCRPAGAARGVCRMAAPGAPPPVGRQPCAARRPVGGEAAVPRPCGRVVAAPDARRPRLPRQEADEGGPVVAEAGRRPSPSAACRRPRRPARERPGKARVPGTGAARRSRSGGRGARPSAGGAPARCGRGDPPGGRRSARPSSADATTLRTVATHEPKT